MGQMKGIVLAAGSGSRMKPFTSIFSKHLLPISDKPVIYYSLSILLLAEIRDILIICNRSDLNSFKEMLGNGSVFGIKLSYEIQDKPTGLVDAFRIGEKFINNSPVALILGDNFFYGHGLKDLLLNAKKNIKGANIFGYHVKTPSSYGIAEFDGKNVTNIIEKPKKSISNVAVTGLYFYDGSVCELSKKVKPSKRGELEISSLNKLYLKLNKLNINILHRGFTWFDVGTFDSIFEATNFVQIIENNQKYLIGCLEEIALRNNWINKYDIKKSMNRYGNTNYKKYLLSIVNT